MSQNESLANKEIALIDLLDTILDKGVAIKGDLVISIAGIDLVYLDLRILLASVESLVDGLSDQQNDVTPTIGTREGG